MLLPLWLNLMGVFGDVRFGFKIVRNRTLAGLRRSGGK